MDLTANKIKKSVAPVSKYYDLTANKSCSYIKCLKNVFVVEIFTEETVCIIYNFSVTILFIIN